MMETAALRSPGIRDLPPQRILLGLAVLLAAVWLGWKAWVLNIEASCRLNEWPYLQRCAEAERATPEEKAQRLVDRIKGNPGDSASMVALALLVHKQPGVLNLDANQVLDTAARFAPQDGRVMALQANRAIAQKQWAQALDPLVRLAIHHRDNSAALTLAQLINNGALDATLRADLMAAAKANPDWLSRTVVQMPKAKIPILLAMPYVSVAMEQKRLTQPVARFLIRQLKAEGQWLDAYGIWLYLWNRPVNLLFNGDFEQAFLPGGFDWEPGQTQVHRAGAQVMLSGRGERGQVMQVAFTGKVMASHVVKQDVLLTPGKYRFEGEFQASELRSSKGLAWVVRCARDGRELARSEPIEAKGRSWRNFSLEFEFPAECGLGAMLELKPQAAYEATAGMKGEVLIDRLKLERLTP